MKWLAFAFIALNGLLLSLYLDTDKNIGGETLLMVNLPILVAGSIFYVITRVTPKD